MDYEQLKNIVRLKSLDGEDAERFAHFATREIVDAKSGRRLQENLVSTLADMSVGHWDGPASVAGLREKAMAIIDDIQRIAGSSGNKRRSS